MHCSQMRVLTLNIAEASYLHLSDVDPLQKKGHSDGLDYIAQY